MNIEELYVKYQEANYQVSTDTRKIEKGSLYFALKGDRFDGNQYAHEALDKGASLAIIDDKNQSTEGTFLVENVLETLQALAKYHREKLQTPIIAITGSNGKTTTKELINSVLSESFVVVATQGNLNNHIGVPLTLLSIRPDTDIAIVEMGANHPKEIEFLCQIAQPDYGYITNFGKAHLEGFGSLEGVVKAKSELYDYLKEHQKVIFYNISDTRQKEILSSYDKALSFGNDEKANYQISVENSQENIVLNYQDTPISSQLTGIYNIPNISIAVAIGRYFKMSPSTIARGLGRYVPTNNRSQWVQIKSNRILLDAYNANPTSMRAAIANIRQMDAPQKVLVLGDMKELGDYSLEEHQAIADELATTQWKEVCLVGEEFSKAKTSFHQFKNFEELEVFLEEQNFQDTLFLIKGSRAMALERVVEVIEKL